MLFTTWDPLIDWQEMLADTFPALAGPFEEYPLVNVWSQENGSVVTAEVPGLEPGDIEISAHGDTLTLRGSRKPEVLKEGEVRHRNERPCGEFSRTLRLPFRIDSEHVQARLNNGVLSLTLPRAAEDKPRKIAVKAS
jgi:HSP20 family protein